MLLLCAGTVVFRNWYVDHATAREQAKVDQWATEQGKKGSWPAAKKALDTQAAALLRGDEQGWLAAVDPAQPQLRDYYRRLYTAMRALDVSGWEYFVTSPGPYENWGASWIELDFTIGYCVAVATCTRYDSRTDPLRIGSAIGQRIRLDKRDGAYRIVAVKATEYYRPTPWQNTELMFARGKRVVVAAPAGQTGRMAEAVAAADQAATVADRFAGDTGYKPQRYRVYLAGDNEWAAWGTVPRYAAGYASPTGKLGADVVVKMSAAPGRGDLVEILRHEFGHVVTLGGTDHTADAVFDIDSWLEEGVAEYIAHTPTPPASTGRVAALRRAGAAPTTLLLAPLDDHSTDTDVDRLYGYGYLAVACMADRYGQTKTMRFVTAKLRDGESLEQAARHAFDRSFAAVEKTCTTYFKTTVG
ncbi:hypothetical protein Adu01nite_47990 [Paractinoplanes durhamensis]|uniref:Uncharacterized protein n=1 Tax=Paractinoplanes durhamensis TaxID=113563 RepID=A0ABQ3Z1J5_9ACTN|nr:hypothetical protein Adu01nite_47990 [Actinoplanes durhamensis]